MTDKKDTDISFEDALGELETLVDTMETGDLSLEDSLKSFERGVHLTKTCQAALKQAEQTVKTLSDQSIDEIDSQASDKND